MGGARHDYAEGCHNARPHAAPKEVTFVTFDVYGTLIDWETGVYDAFSKEAERDGFTISRDELDPALPRDPAGDQGRLLRALRRGAAPHRRARSRASSAGRSSPRARASCPTRSALAAVQGDQHAARALRARSSRRPDLEHRRQAARPDPPPLHGATSTSWSPPSRSAPTSPTPRTSRSASAASAPRRAGSTSASSYYHDVEPCLKAKVPVIWVNRNKEQLEPGAEEADGRGQDAARGGEAARRRLSGARASASTPTSSSPVRGSSRRTLHARRARATRRSASTRPCSPTSWRSCRRCAEQAGFAVVGLLATHADWDHLLGRYAFPEAPLGCGGDDRGAAAPAQPGEAQRELRDFDDEHYVERPAPLALRALQALPVPGHCGVGDARARAAPGRRPHGRRHGDLGPVGARARLRRLPLAGRDPDAQRRAARRGAYLATLARLEPLVEQADHVVPGHGAPLDGARAAAILREDRAYLEALLERGAAAQLPLARRIGGPAADPRRERRRGWPDARSSRPSCARSPRRSSRRRSSGSRPTRPSSAAHAAALRGRAPRGRRR